MSERLKPKEMDAAQRAFPANVIGTYLPEWDEIPDEFRHHHGNEWTRLVRKWFFRGLKDPQFHSREGVVAEMAFHHVGACMRSFQPKHEHKEAGCAFLLSEFFVGIKEGDQLVAGKEHE